MEEKLKKIKAYTSRRFIDLIKDDPELVNRIYSLIPIDAVPIRIKLQAHKNKGSGKCWLARKNGTKLEFIDPVEVEKDGYRVYKTYLIEAYPGEKFEICTEGGKSSDRRFTAVVDDEGRLCKNGYPIKEVIS